MRVNTRKLKKEQYKLAERVELKDGFSRIKYIGACDHFIADDKLYSGIVVLEYKTMKIVDQAYAVADVKMPFIPGLQGYREGPAIVEAFGKLEVKPDLLLVDGHGIAHPRKIGIASHVGLLLDIPTIGIGKKLIVGDVKEGKVWYDREIRGFEVITKEHALPIYVSPGHKVSLGSSLSVVKDCIKGHKLPEPCQMCHKYLNRIKKNNSNNDDEKENKELS